MIEPTRSPRPGSRLVRKIEYRTDITAMPSAMYGNQSYGSAWPGDQPQRAAMQPFG